MCIDVPAGDCEVTTCINTVVIGIDNHLSAGDSQNGLGLDTFRAAITASTQSRDDSRTAGDGQVAVGFDTFSGCTGSGDVDITTIDGYSALVYCYTFVRRLDSERTTVHLEGIVGVYAIRSRSGDNNSATLHQDIVIRGQRVLIFTGKRELTVTEDENLSLGEDSTFLILFIRCLRGITVGVRQRRRANQRQEETLLALVIDDRLAGRG